MTDVDKLIESFAQAAETNRLRGAWADQLDEEPWSEFREWAESLNEVADAIDAARDALAEWRDAEDREYKRDAKDAALDALDQLVNAWNNSPLDLSKFETWQEEGE